MVSPDRGPHKDPGRWRSRTPFCADGGAAERHLRRGTLLTQEGTLTLRTHTAALAVTLMTLTGTLSPATISAQAASEHPELGAPRDDLERFFGVYGEPDGRRNFFVAEARSQPDARDPVPSGYLMIGAMWGDAAPWYMKALEETRFEQAWVGEYQPEPLTVVFELGPDGRAVALRFETLFDDRGRLERVGDLPEGW